MIQYRAMRGRTLSQKSSCKKGTSNCRFVDKSMGLSNLLISCSAWNHLFPPRCPRHSAPFGVQAGCTPGVTGCARTWNTHHSQIQCNWEVLQIQQQVEHIQTKDLIPEQIFYLNILVLFTFFLFTFLQFSCRENKNNQRSFCTSLSIEILQGSAQLSLPARP